MSWSTRQTLVYAVAAGLFFACIAGAQTYLSKGGSTASVVVSAVVGGVVSAALFGGLFLSREFRAAEAAGLDQLTLRDRRRAVRAATRGPVPASPTARHAALAMVRRRGRWHAVRGGWLYRGLFGAFTALTAIMAVRDAPYYWIVVVLAAVAFAYTEWERRVLPRRIEVLEAAAG